MEVELALVLRNNGSSWGIDRKPGPICAVHIKAPLPGFIATSAFAVV
jgi:hypothetical protein